MRNKSDRAKPIKRRSVFLIISILMILLSVILGGRALTESNRPMITDNGWVITEQNREAFLKEKKEELRKLRQSELELGDEPMWSDGNGNYFSLSGLAGAHYKALLSMLEEHDRTIIILWVLSAFSMVSSLVFLWFWLYLPIKKS